MPRCLAVARACVALLGAAVPAQQVCEGSPTGAAFLTTTVAPVGGTLHMTVGSPNAPNGIGMLAFGNGAGPVFPSCLDTSGLFLGMVALLDGSGAASFALPIAPATPVHIAIFARAVIDENGLWAESKTVRVATEHRNATHLLAGLAQARAHHTVTSFAASPRDARTGAIAAGGATGSLLDPMPLASTERFDSLTRTWSPGPTMAVPRAMHGAVRLADGRILIAGGMTSQSSNLFGGPGTTHCEIYDPATNGFTATGPLHDARLGHGISLLPDGRVLVSGGFADWSDPGSGANFLANANSVLASTELWDPVTGQWSPGPTMATPRARHSQTVLANGDLLLAGGVRGGTGTTAPYHYVLTATCERFAPSTSTLAPTGAMATPRAFHTALRLANDRVLASGGAAPGPLGATATATCEQYDAATGTWSAAAALPTGIAFHTACPGPNGEAVLLGGHAGLFTSVASFAANSWYSATWWHLGHDGTATTARTPLGWDPVLPNGNPWVTGGHAACLLHDGTILATGGYAGSPTLQGLTLPTTGLVIAP